VTARQRVITAFEFRKADRIPRYEMFLEGFVDRWARKHRNLRPDTIYDYYYSALEKCDRNW